MYAVQHCTVSGKPVDAPKRNYNNYTDRSTCNKNKGKGIAKPEASGQKAKGMVAIAKVLAKKQ
jgi:hypothetical protein